MVSERFGRAALLGAVLLGSTAPLAAHPFWRDERVKAAAPAPAQEAAPSTSRCEKPSSFGRISVRTAALTAPCTPSGRTGRAVKSA